MKALEKLNIKDILFFDFETVRQEEVLKIDTRAYDLFEKKNRDRVTGEVLESSKLIELYKTTAALSPVHTQIVCATVGFVNEGAIRIKSITGEESDIINEFCELLSKFKMVCGHNILGYDLNVLLTRALHHGLTGKIPEKFNTSGKKPWSFDGIVIDLMNVVKGTFYSNISFDETCYLLGVDSPKIDIDGSQVSDVFYSEGIQRIEEYCERDVVASVQCFLKITNADMITDVVTKSETKITSINVLEELFNKSDIDDSVRDGVRKLLDGKKITKKDNTIIKDMLYSLSLEEDFMKSDSQAAKDLKLREVEGLMAEFTK